VEVTLYGIERTSQPSATTTMKQATSAKTSKGEASFIQSKLSFGGSTRVAASNHDREQRSERSAGWRTSSSPLNLSTPVKGTKNHEFRKYMISKTVRQMW